MAKPPNPITQLTLHCQRLKQMNNASLRTHSQSLNNDYQKRFAPIGKRHFQMMLAAMLVTLLYATYITQFNTPTKEESATYLKTTNLVFKDDQNGDILIEVLPNETATTVTGTSKVLRFSGEQGFLRGTLRALARERRLRNLSPAAPFVLALDQEGRLSITDSLTHKGIDLEAFGPDNSAVFEQLLINATNSTSSSELSKKQTEFSKEMK